MDSTILDICSGGSALELLKKRLVKGEITPEQYRQLRDLLLEK